MLRGNVMVVARFRPLSAKETKEGDSDESYKFHDAKSVQVSDGDPSGMGRGGTFTFDRTFPMNSTQADVYAATGAGMVDELFLGFNCTILAYGQTGSGKTHTMLGDLESKEHGGVIPRLVGSVFRHVDEYFSTSSEVDLELAVTFVEIYMDRVKDLVQPSNRNLKIREDANTGIWIEGVSETVVVNLAEVLDIMSTGQKNRAMASTNMNEHSSRSHSVFILKIIQRQKEDGSFKTSKLILVDLAGSEKVSKTQAAGQTLREAQKINKSLSALGNVIQKLTSGSTHIPYRDSKLTRVLSDSLGGNSKTCLIITASPAMSNMEETLSTMRFGSRAKLIKNKPKVNEEKSIEQYKRELRESKRTVSSLRDEIEALQGAASNGEEIRLVREACEKRVEDVKQTHEKQLRSTQDRHSAALRIKESELRDALLLHANDVERLGGEIESKVEANAAQAETIAQLRRDAEQLQSKMKAAAASHAESLAKAQEDAKNNLEKAVEAEKEVAAKQLEMERKAHSESTRVAQDEGAAALKAAVERTRAELTQDYEAKIAELVQGHQKELNKTQKAADDAKILFEAQIKETESKCTQLEDKLKSSKTAHEFSIAEMEQHCTDTVNEVKAAHEKALDTMRKKGLEAMAKAQSDTKAEAQAEAQKAMDASEAEHQAAMSRAAKTHAAEVSKYQTELKEAENKATKLEQQMEVLRREQTERIRNLEGKITDLESVKTRIEIEVERKAGEATLAAKECKGLENQVEALKGALASSKQSVKAVSKQADRTASDLDASRKQVSEAKKEMQLAKDDAAAKDAEIAELRQQIKKNRADSARRQRLAVETAKSAERQTVQKLIRAQHEAELREMSENEEARVAELKRTLGKQFSAELEELGTSLKEAREQSTALKAQLAEAQAQVQKQSVPGELCESKKKSGPTRSFLLYNSAVKQEQTPTRSRLPSDGKVAGSLKTPPVPFRRPPQPPRSRSAAVPNVASPATPAGRRVLGTSTRHNSDSVLISPVGSDTSNLEKTMVKFDESINLDDAARSGERLRLYRAKERLEIRSQASDSEDGKTGKAIESNVMFRVCDEVAGQSGQRFLQLADETGWVLARHPEMKRSLVMYLGQFGGGTDASVAEDSSLSHSHLSTPFMSPSPYLQRRRMFDYRSNRGFFMLTAISVCISHGVLEDYGAIREVTSIILKIQDKAEELEIPFYLYHVWILQQFQNLKTLSARLFNTLMQNREVLSKLAKQSLERLEDVNENDSHSSHSRSGTKERSSSQRQTALLCDGPSIERRANA